MSGRQTRKIIAYIYEKKVESCFRHQNDNRNQANGFCKVKQIPKIQIKTPTRLYIFLLTWDIIPTQIIMTNNICVHCCQNRPKVGIVICRCERSKCISLQVPYSRLVRDLIKSMSLFRMALVSNQSGSLFYDYFTT